MTSVFLHRSWSVVFVLGFLAGCGGTVEVPQPEVEARLKAVAVFYGRFAGQHQGASPKSLDEFKAYLNTLSPEEFATLRVKNVDELLVSPRDQQPFTIVFGAASGPPGTSAPGGGVPGAAQSPVAYEAVGVQGRRYVGFSLGMVQELDEQEFRKISRN